MIENLPTNPDSIDPKDEIREKIITLKKSLADPYPGPMDTEVPGTKIRREIINLQKQLDSLS